MSFQLAKSTSFQTKPESPLLRNHCQSVQVEAGDLINATASLRRVRLITVNRWSVDSLDQWQGGGYLQIHHHIELVFDLKETRRF